MTKRNVTIVLLIALIGFGIHRYVTWLDRVEYLRWLSSRQQHLNQVGLRIADCVEENGRYPSTLSELIESGILTKSEVDFRDETCECRVWLEYRPVSASEIVSSFAIIIERYGPPHGGANVLESDGHATFFPNADSAISKDNKLRIESGMSPLPLKSVPDASR